ncbi:MAG: redoxin domain-containing protein [Verrucomicrobiota bacterium]
MKAVILAFGWIVCASLVWGSGREYRAELGQKAPGWEIGEWVIGEGVDLVDLKGKVVLVRWFTGDHCPYCSATAPALNGLLEAYGERGLEVVGMYHHKSPEPFGVEEVEALVKGYGFTFPVGIDEKWAVLKRWWLFDEARKWTSVSFLLDREGRIAWVHPGGKYEKGDADYIELTETIEGLLDDKEESDL